MTRRARSASESGWYHVTMRGAGRRALFESDEDREAYLKTLTHAVDRSDGAVEVAAWCLMDNHVHLIMVAEQLPDLQRCIHRSCSGYAIRFNRRNGHVGPVFQERFASFPIESDAYLMEAIRYVHLNCRDKGIANPSDDPWSSYRAYVDGPRSSKMEEVIRIFGGIDGFKGFHASDAWLGCDEAPVHRKRLSDEEARRIARIQFGEDFVETVPLMSMEKRDQAVQRLFAAGLSTRQIERMTGIGRGVIRRVCGLK